MKTNAIEYEYPDRPGTEFVIPNAMTIVIDNSRIRYVPETVEVVVHEPPKSIFAVGDIVEVDKKAISTRVRGKYGVVSKVGVLGLALQITVEFGDQNWAFDDNPFRDLHIIHKAATS